jgi:acetyl esterase/lipase
MKHRLLVAPAFLASAVAGQQVGPVALANVPVPPALHIAYGTDSLQFGELRLPKGSGPYPVAIVVHGGCWLARLGSLDSRVLTDYMRPLAAALTEAGIATWSVHYRLLGNDGGGWPGTFRDLGDATDFLRTIARKYSLDLTRVVAIGHSSGGHFAMWLADRSRIPTTSDLYVPDPLRLSAAINLDGPADLRATLPLQQDICGAPVVSDLVGGAPDQQAQRYRAASPVELLPSGIPQVYFAGRMFAAQVAPYEAAATAAGDEVHSMALPDAGHFVFVDPHSDVWPQVLKAVRQVLGLPE